MEGGQQRPPRLLRSFHMDQRIRAARVADDAPDLSTTAHMRLSRAVAQRATNLSMDAQCRIMSDSESERERVGMIEL